MDDKIKPAYNSIKGLLKSILGACDAIDRNSIIKQRMNLSGKMRDIVTADIATYLVYLCVADNEIKNEELDLIEDLLGWKLSAQQVEYIANQKKLNGASFARQIPPCIKLLIKAGAIGHSYNRELTAVGLAQSYVELTTGLGVFMLAIDNEITQEEIDAYETYNRTIKNFLLQGFPNITFNVQELPLEPTNKQTDYSQVGNVTDEPEDENVEGNSEKKSYQELMDELNSLTGLQQVKQDVSSLINLLQIMKMREKRGLKKIPMSLHLVFSGNPGTGKTTVARLLAQIYRELGVLSKGQLIEVDRAGLVGGYVGQTASKVKEVVKKAIGGVLFIDEAYALTVNKGDNDYGYEAVDTLLKEMEDHRDNLVVIVAGYTEQMESFLNANPGLKSRFNKFFTFSDYTPDEMVEIFKGICLKNNYEPTEETLTYTAAYFAQKYDDRDINFANAREVRNFFEQAMTNQANRLACQTSKITEKDLFELIVEDVSIID